MMIDILTGKLKKPDNIEEASASFFRDINELLFIVLKEKKRTKGQYTREQFIDLMFKNLKFYLFKHSILDIYNKDVLGEFNCKSTEELINRLDGMSYDEMINYIKEINFKDFPELKNYTKREDARSKDSHKNINYRLDQVNTIKCFSEGLINILKKETIEHVDCYCRSHEIGKYLKGFNVEIGAFRKTEKEYRYEIRLTSENLSAYFEYEG